MRSHLSQSLAGRAAWCGLPPFSLRELGDQAPPNADEAMIKGFYPPLYDRPFDSADWYSQYVQTYLEKDLTQILRVKEHGAFHRFLRLCAGRTGQILNMSDLARDADISHTTVREWLSVLEASYLVFLLQPWHENYNKRLTKSPKLYFFDTGLAACLIGCATAEQLATHPLRGPLFETMLVAELIKQGMAETDRADWYYWNNSGVMEVDLLCWKDGKLHATEIKSGATFRPEQLQNLRKWAELSGTPASRLQLLYGGRESFTHAGIKVRGWREARIE